MDYPVSVAGVNLLNGKFTDGNPSGGVPASLDPSEWSNLVTDEMLNVITAAGLTPNETSNNQLAIAIQSGLLNYGADTGAANAYVVGYDPAVTALYVGQTFRFLALHTNTAGCTLNVGLGPDPLLGLGGVALQGGEIPALSLVEVAYVGAAGFVLLYANGGAQQLSAGSYGVTPAQFDNSNKIASTAYVVRAQGSWAGQTNYAVNTTLTAADVGKVLVMSGNAVLPVASTVPAGARVKVVSTGGANRTVTAQGTDTIGLQIGTSVASVVVVNQGYVVFERNAVGNGWNVAEGDASLQWSPYFSASLALSGYQKLPSGLIIQWAGGVASANTTTTFNFPIAFPNGCASIVASFQVPWSGAQPNIQATSASQYQVQQTSSSGGNFHMIAIGY